MGERGVLLYFFCFLPLMLEDIEERKGCKEGKERRKGDGVNEGRV